MSCMTKLRRLLQKEQREIVLIKNDFSFLNKIILKNLH